MLESVVCLISPLQPWGVSVLRGPLLFVSAAAPGIL